MSTSFTPPSSPLRLARSVSTAPFIAPAETESARHALRVDLEALLVREDNLRAYEARLRDWQARLDARPGGAAEAARAPLVAPTDSAGDAAAVRASWEKLHRAREILEAESAVMRDERMALREQERVLRERQAVLAQREERVAAGEAALSARAGAVAARPVARGEAPPTRSPFQFARTVWRGAK